MSGCKCNIERLVIQYNLIKIKKHQRKAFSVFKYGLNCLNNILLNLNNKININVLQFLLFT